MVGKFLKKLVVAAAMIASFGAEAQVEYVKVEDLALIWIGARHRPDWNKELFTPYLVHDFADGHRSWLFDGFLMLDGYIQGEPPTTCYSFGEAPFECANKEMWNNLMIKQMGLNDGLGCRALDDRIGELIPELGAPATKHQVVMMLPIPVGASQMWGKINDVPMNFGSINDRITAMKWYVDLLLERWAAADYKNIELAGIYWIREAIDNDIEPQLAKAMNEYAHTKGLKTYWIPYYNATNYQNGKEMGFDQVYLQPNYVFSLDRPLSQLENAIANVYENEMAIMLEFEGNCISGIDDDRQLVSQWNSCMYEASVDYYNRFVDYIDKFEESWVFDLLPVTYYSGFQAVYDFAKSTHPKDIEVLDRLSSIIEKRHVDSGWYDSKQAGISDVISDEPMNIYGIEGAIYVGNNCGNVTVYSLDGKIVTSTTGNDIEASDFHYGFTIPCQAGVYVARSGNRTTKVLVK